MRKGTTLTGTIALPPVTPGTDNDLCMATTTMIKATGNGHRQKGRCRLDGFPKWGILNPACFCMAFWGMASTETVKSEGAPYPTHRLFLYNVYYEIFVSLLIYPAKKNTPFEFKMDESRKWGKWVIFSLFGK